MRRILLIDDTPEIAELLTFALRDQGYKVFATGYTVSVNELILEQQAEALVLDCSSLDMSESLFDAVRQHPDHAEFPIVIVSDTPEEADAYVSDQSPDAYERLVDRLLASPHYGERWGRRWLVLSL